MLDPTRPESAPSFGALVKVLSVPEKVFESVRRVEDANFQVEVEKV